MNKKRLLSGYQPSGRSHIGNYLGAIRNWAELQNEYDSYFFIADYHSISQNYDPKQKPSHILNAATDLIAGGIDPKKSTLFIQSDMPQHMELAWILNCVTPVSYLERMTQFKDKASHQEKNINMGLFSYPILQAADILMYKPYGIPVGQDQIQHVELSRSIARFFNKRFKNIFPEPKPILSKIPKVYSLQAPDKKMSKSLGDKHNIYLDDSPKDIHEKISKAVTDTGDGNSSGAKNLLELLKEFGDEKTYNKFCEKQKSRNIRYSDLKKELSDSLSKYFLAFRKKKTALMKNPQNLIQTLQEGAKKASKMANKTLAEVREAVGVEYK